MLTRKTEDGGRKIIGRSRPVETPEYGKMVARMIRSYGRRVADADEVDLAQMLAMSKELDKAIVKAVHGQRTVWGRSWAYIAEAAGITRQAAQQRWGKAVAQLSVELLISQSIDMQGRVGCKHEESLHGRCTTCGMTWEEQAS